jgi:phosphoadenosine phosphosulfate reductase
MYNYIWDTTTGGYILDTKISGVVKELRPVFHEELDLLGFNRYWKYEKSENPLLWAETRHYVYKGECVAEAIGGGLYTQPELKIHKHDLVLEPVDIKKMVSQNRAIFNALVQDTGKFIYKKYQEYKDKVDISYVAFSGGKDSITLLDLVQKSLPHNTFKVVFSDTTMEVIDTYKAIERAQTRWPTLEFVTTRCHMDARKTWELFGPPGRVQRWCCAVHKSAPSLLKLQSIVNTQRENSLKKESLKIKALVFDGVRAEESDARSTYPLVSDGKKHSIQINCSPILNWSTSEIFLYIFENNLLLNDAYRYGAIRVGCAVCPTSSQWWDFISSKVYGNDIKDFIDIIENNNKNKIKTGKELHRYIDAGGWKGRMGGRDIKNGGSKIVEQKLGDFLVINVTEPRSDWKEWIKTIGYLVKIDDSRYSIQHKGISYDLEIVETENKVKVRLRNNIHTKDTIRFIYLLKNVFNKAAYCVTCRVCIVECPYSALSIESGKIKVTEKCKHCESCLDMPKGCLAAKSLAISIGGNSMDLKGINRYQHFGFRKTWLKYFFEEKNEFWNCGKLGKYQFDGFRVWLKEAELTTNNAFNDLSEKLSIVGVDNLNVWAIICVNLAYNSTIFRWYIKNTDFNVSYDTNALVSLLGNSQSVSHRENAVTSLKETFRFSPIGTDIGFGVCNPQAKRSISITRTSWLNPSPLVILYSLYKFAEKCDGYYAFTLSYLCDDKMERGGISPTTIFGIDVGKMRDKLRMLATDYPDLISVDFNKDLDNIDLKKDKCSLDIIRLF